MLEIVRNIKKLAYISIIKLFLVDIVFLLRYKRMNIKTKKGIG